MPSAVLPANLNAQLRYPSRAVRYVVPYAPGGPTDQIGRLVAAEMSVLWGHPVVVENRPGANANIGAEMVAHAPADGHVLLQGTSSTHGTNPALYARLPYDAQHDFRAVVGLVEGPVYLVVPAGGFSSLAQLLQHARANPHSVHYGTSGLGSPQHMAGELLQARTGAPLTAVHYRGAAPALLAMKRGEIDLYFDSRAPGTAGADLRVLAVSTRWRWPLAPEVPTMVELGVADFEIHGWFGVFAPRSTAPELIDRINQTVNAVLEKPAVRQRIEALGFRVLGGKPQDLEQRVRRDLAYWGEVVRSNGIRVE